MILMARHAFLPPRNTASVRRLLLAAILSCIPGALATGDELDSLREIESRLQRTIAETMPAVVFVDRGSGVVISSEGLVLTNDHVVGDRKRVPVRFALSGLKRTARLLGRYPEGDLALLSIDQEGTYPHLELGDSDALRPGQRVIALGNPFLLGEENSFFPSAAADFHPSVSFGVVSALYRNTPPRYPAAVQVDVAVNPGNSGGPLVTLEGEIVGINGKIETRLGLSLNSGVGYAVPSSQVRRFLEPLRNAQGRTITHGQLFGLQVNERTEASAPGLAVKLVVQGSQAERAGFRVGDRILSVDNYLVTTENRLSGILRTYPVGSEVTFHVVRDEESRAIETTLEPVPNEKPVKLGIRARPSRENPDLLQISEVLQDSPAERAGLRVDDILLQFDGKTVKTVADLILEVRAKKSGDVVIVKLRREAEELDLPVLLKNHDD